MKRVILIMAIAATIGVGLLCVQGSGRLLAPKAIEENAEVQPVVGPVIPESLAVNPVKDEAGTEAQSDDTTNEESPDKHPKAVIDQVEHDFGVMEQTGMCQWSFTIANEGEAPLKLDRGPTTCKCTMSALPPHPIPPGVLAEVQVGSKTENKEGFFSHSATIYTNDPDNDSIRLTIKGIIQKFLATQPAEIVFPTLQRGQAANGQAVVYSQAWSKFAIEDVSSSLEGLTWEISPAGAETLADLKAQSGYRIKVTVPVDAECSGVRTSLDMKIVPEDKPDDVREFSLGILGNVPPRLRLRGRSLAIGRVLDLGTMLQGQTAKERLTMTIHDEVREIEVRRIETEPKFLKVDVVPYKEGASSLGVYRIDVEVPPDATPCSYQRPKFGKIVIETDHPRIPKVEIKVELLVGANAYR